MKTTLLACLAVAMLTVSCAAEHKQLQPRLSRTPGGTEALARCAVLFPQGRWQFVHAIDFRMADGSGGNALGVVVLDGDQIQTALMTVEGLTLFEASSSGDENIQVTRAIAPFDRPGFAAGLMQDVRTLFRPPTGKARYGSLANGSRVCRYEADPATTDITPSRDGCWQLSTYSHLQQTRFDGCLLTEIHHERPRTRTITASSCQSKGGAAIPQTLVLAVPGPTGYTLTMRLISAEPLPATR